MTFEKFLGGWDLAILEASSRVFARDAIRISSPAHARCVLEDRPQPRSHTACIVGRTSQCRDPCVLYEVVCTLMHKAARELTKPASVREQIAWISSGHRYTDAPPRIALVKSDIEASTPEAVIVQQRRIRTPAASTRRDVRSPVWDARKAPYVRGLGSSAGVASTRRAGVRLSQQLRCFSSCCC